MTPQPTPALAVVVPTFNRASTIRRAVDSVLSNPRPDFQLIVVDDSSSDNTLEILAGIPDPRLKVIRMGTTGNANTARNRGVSETNAPLLAFLDSDDEFLPGRIDRIIDFFAATPDADVLADGFEAVRKSSRKPFVHPTKWVSGQELTGLLVTHALPITCSSIAMRRSAFESISGFDEGLPRHQDRDILLRLARGHRVVLFTGADVVKHQGEDSFSRKAAGYISGLDDLVARHPAFLEPRSRDVLGYLIARVVIREFSSGRFRSGGEALHALKHAPHLPLDAWSSLLRYRSGRRIRRAAEAKLQPGHRDERIR